MKVFVVLFALATIAYSKKIPQWKIAFSSGDIIDGVDAQPNEAPFIVSLNRGSHFCAGSIIRPNWILTAAHCLIYTDFKAIAGLHVRSDMNGTQERSITSKDQYIVHEKYKGGVGPNDIGLIYFPEPFDLTALNVKAIDLPAAGMVLSGDGTILGWGQNRAGVLPQVLQKLDTNVLGYAECKKELPYQAPIADVNICTKGVNKYEGACNGDSGGPLVKYITSGAVLIGIVSWGYVPCAATSYPSVFTSTAYYTDWISKTIDNYKP